MEDSDVLTFWFIAMVNLVLDGRLARQVRRTWRLLFVPEPPGRLDGLVLMWRSLDLATGKIDLAR